MLPPASVHLGWSSYAAVWLSRIPKMIPGHFIAARSTGAVREEFERQAAKDWEAFLSLRARELRRGGQLVVVLPALAEDGSSGIQNLMDQPAPRHMGSFERGEKSLQQLMRHFPS